MDKKTFEKTILSKSPGETEKIGENFAGKILKLKSNIGIVLSLEGELGGGKTTFLKGFARGLGIKDRIKSPTFVIMRKHRIGVKYFKLAKFKYFYHFDCYRVDDLKEILDLGFNEIVESPGNIAAVEWGDKIKKILPQNCIKIKFKTRGRDKREIKILKLWSFALILPCFAR